MKVGWKAGSWGGLRGALIRPSRRSSSEKTTDKSADALTPTTTGWESHSSWDSQSEPHDSSAPPLRMASDDRVASDDATTPDASAPHRNLTRVRTSPHVTLGTEDSLISIEAITSIGCGRVHLTPHGCRRRR